MEGLSNNKETSSNNSGQILHTEQKIDEVKSILKKTTSKRLKLHDCNDSPSAAESADFSSFI